MKYGTSKTSKSTLLDEQAVSAKKQSSEEKESSVVNSHKRVSIITPNVNHIKTTVYREEVGVQTPAAWLSEMRTKSPVPSPTNSEKKKFASPYSIKSLAKTVYKRTANT